MAISGRTWRIGSSEYLNKVFTIYEEDATGRLRLFFEDEPAKPDTGWTIYNYTTGGYSVSLDIYYEDEAVSLGSASFSATPENPSIKLEITKAEVDALTEYGTYYGMVKTSAGIDVLQFSVDIVEEPYSNYVCAYHCTTGNEYSPSPGKKCRLLYITSPL